MDALNYRKYKWKTFESGLDRKSRTSFWRSILAKVVSDLGATQWITGLAIIVTRFATQCDISVYHANLIIYLAMLSTTTQISTFVVLSAEFRKYRRVLSIRILGFIVTLAMLFYFVSQQLQSKGWCFSSQCSFSTSHDGDTITTDYILYPAFCFLQSNVTSHSSAVTAGSDTIRSKDWWTLLITNICIIIAFTATLPALYKWGYWKNYEPVSLGNENERKENVSAPMVVKIYYVVRSILGIIVPLAIAVWCIVRLFDTRHTLHRGSGLSDISENQWTFGQVLALCLIGGTGRSIWDSLISE
jgi:hypothetical protein